MNVLRIRNEMRNGKTIFDLPLRVTFYARVSTDKDEQLNSLDSDSEFRLVVMAGVAQDEVRKLSERLKFGFRQAIKNGHVLGNDKLWGYDKRTAY